MALKVLDMLGWLRRNYKKEGLNSLALSKIQQELQYKSVTGSHLQYGIGDLQKFPCRTSTQFWIVDLVVNI